MKLQDVLKEEEEQRTYRILLSIPFADNNNIKGKLARLEFDLKQNGIEIKRIASSTLGQNSFVLDIRTGLVISTTMKRTEVESILEPEYNIIKFTEDSNASWCI